jgi:hypothetical protein
MKKNCQSFYIILSSITILVFCIKTNVLFADENIKWIQLSQSVEVGRTEYTIPEINEKVRFEIIRANPDLVDVKVISSVNLIKRKKRKYAAYSLREIDSILKPLAVINGGYTQSFSYPIPAGLIVIDSKAIMKLNKGSRLQSGVLCIKKNSNKIISKNKYKPNECDYALQCGPKIIEFPGKKGINSRKRKFSRSVVAIDKTGRILFIKSSSISLYDLADFLLIDFKNGGLEVNVALNLSGNVESGLIYRNMNVTNFFGDIDAPIASAIGIFSKPY